MVAKSKPAEELKDEQADALFRDRLYPWTEWFDGKCRMLSLTEHFPGFKSLFVARNYIRLAAKRRGLKVRLRRYEASGKIAVQVIPHDAQVQDAPHENMEAKRTRVGRSLRNGTPSSKRRE